MFVFMQYGTLACCESFSFYATEYLKLQICACFFQKKFVHVSQFC